MMSFLTIVILMFGGLMEKILKNGISLVLLLCGLVAFLFGASALLSKRAEVCADSEVYKFTLQPWNRLVEGDIGCVIKFETNIDVDFTYSICYLNDGTPIADGLKDLRYGEYKTITIPPSYKESLNDVNLQIVITLQNGTKLASKAFSIKWQNKKVCLLSIDANNGDTEHFCIDYAINENGSSLLLSRITNKNVGYGCEFVVPKNKEQSGWQVGEQVYGLNDSITITENTAIKALWKWKEFAVDFDKNGGQGEMQSITISENYNYTLPSCGFTADADKEFAGWQVGENEYSVGDEIEISANTVVKAIWAERSSFKVVLSNGGSESIDDIYVAYPYKYTLPANQFNVPRNHSFGGWQVGSEVLEVGSEIDVLQDTTITAIWTRTAYDVIFYAGGGDGSMAKVVVNVGESYTLPDCDFIAPQGKIFAGWLVNGTEYLARSRVTLQDDTGITALWTCYVVASEENSVLDFAVQSALQDAKNEESGLVIKVGACFVTIDEDVVANIADTCTEFTFATTEKKDNINVSIRFGEESEFVAKIALNFSERKLKNKEVQVFAVKENKKETALDSTLVGGELTFVADSTKNFVVKFKSTNEEQESGNQTIYYVIGGVGAIVVVGAVVLIVFVKNKKKKIIEEQ